MLKKRDTESTAKNIIIPGLQLPSGTHAQNIEEKEDGIHVHCTVTATRAYAPLTGEVSTTILKSDDPVTIRTFTCMGLPVFIHYRPRRFKGRKNSFTHDMGWREKGSRLQASYELYLLQAIGCSTVSDVAQLQGLSEDVLHTMLSRYREKAKSKELNWSGITGITMDEIASKKGHGNYYTLILGILDCGKVRILGLVDGHDKESVEPFLRGIPENAKKKLEFIGVDLWEAYHNTIYAVFGKSAKKLIVADRFHVAKLYGKSFDTLRKEEMNRLKKELEESEYKELKGAMWALRKRPGNLGKEERKILKRVFKHSPLLKLGYRHKQRLTKIFDEGRDPATARRKLHRWIESVKRNGLACYNSFVKTLTKNLTVISNYFKERRNSGVAEGINQKAKLIKRRGYGIHDRETLFQRLILGVEGIDVYM